MRRPRTAHPPVVRSAFAGFRFPPEVITVAVRWYLRYGLSYRDIEELLARLRPMRGLKRFRSAARIAAGHRFVQNLRRGHYELAIDVPPRLRLATAFTELALAV